MDTSANQPKQKEPVVTGTSLGYSVCDHVVRWASVPEGKLEALEVYRAAKPGVSLDAAKAPDCLEICNIVGLTENDVFDGKTYDVEKFKFKVHAGRFGKLPKGIEVRASIFKELERLKETGVKMYVLVNAYVIPKRLAYTLKIRVEARRERCRKRKSHSHDDEERQVPAKRIIQVVEEVMVYDLSDEIMDLSIEKLETGPVIPTEVQPKVHQEGSKRPGLKRQSNPAHNVYSVVEQVRNARSNTVEFNTTVSFDPAEILNISKMQMKNSFKLKWDPTHECQAVRTMQVPAAIQRLICSVKACPTGSAQRFPKALALLNNSRVRPIFLRILKFFKKYKHLYSLFMVLLRKWETRVAGKESKKTEVVVSEKVTVSAEKKFSQQNLSSDMDNTQSQAFSDISNLSLLGIPTVTQVVGRNGTIKVKVRGRKAYKRQQDEAKLKATTSIDGSVPYKPILSTISQMLRLSGIEKLLGSQKNCRGLIRFLKRSVFLGGNRCELPLKYLMDEMSIVGVKWIPKITPEQEAWYILAKVAKWVVEDFVCMMLQTVFYVTETTSGRNQLAFFKKSRWISTTEAMRYKYKLKSELAQADNATEVNAKLRFVPKKNGGVRPICSFTKEHKLKIGMEKSSFKDSMMLLKYLATKLAPLSSLDTTHFYSLWKNFLQEWKKVGCPKLYYLKTDIANAFPAVNVQHLRKILTDFGEKVGNLWIESYKRKSNKLIAINPKWQHTYKDFVVDALRRKNPYIAERPWQGWNYHRYQKFDAKAALKPILSSLDPAVVQLGLKKYTFRQGLLQGSIASQLLCAIYYGSLEREHIGSFFNVKKTEIFLRVVDDYIFVSVEKERVRSLLKLMISSKESSHQSVAEFKLNVEKTRHNLNLSSADSALDSEVTFWGYRLFLKTGHVGRDYSSYANADMCTTVSCNIKGNLVGKEIAFISERLKFLGSLRLAQMMFDRSINCEAQVLRNLMHAGCMTAFRLYALMRILYCDLSALDKNEKVMKELFAGIFSFALRLVRFGLKMDEQLSSDTAESHEPGSKHNCECMSRLNEGRPHEFVRDTLKRIQKAKTERKLEPLVLLKNRFLLAIIYGMYLKLTKHQTTFRSILLPKLEEWMREIIVRLGYSRSSLVFQWLPNSLPVEFERMKK